MNDVILARAIHVLGVVIWIGGVAFVTLIILPAIRRRELGDDQLGAFQSVEHRFVRYARSTVLVVGLTGFYICWRLDLWDRFHQASFWWMHAMVGVWLTFMLLLFALEPLILHRRFAELARRKPDYAFNILHRAHLILLALSAATILGAVAGSQGWSIF